MKRMMRCLTAIGLALLIAGSALAQAGVVQSVTEGYQKEIDTYCKNVTPGKGRILACLYAYGDKLSSRCEFALYDASVQLERAVNALSYVANECRGDLNT